MEKTYIYVLKDPRTDEVKYVGKSNDPNDRYRNHINKCRDKNTHKRNWINQLREQKVKPLMEIIDIINKDEWQKFEKFYIKKYLDMGCNLVNCTDGGDGLTFGNKTSYKKGHGSIKIIALHLDGTIFRTFESVVEAVEILNLKKPSIYHVLRKRFRNSAGYSWLYYDEYINMSDEDIKKHIEWSNYKKKQIENKSWFKIGSKPKHKYKTIYQYNLTTGEFIKEWITPNEASKQLNLNSIAIGNCARGKTKSSGKFYWSYEKNKNYKEKEK